MATTQKKMYQGQPATGAQATLYTNATALGAIIKEVIVNNTTATAATITLAVTTSGAAGAAANSILTAKSVPANDLIILALNTAMLNTDLITGAQGTASALTVTISGIERS